MTNIAKISIFSFLLFCISFSQTWVSSGFDTVFIKISVRMVGVCWTLDTLADGWDDDSDTIPEWVWGSSPDYDSFAADAGELDICDILIGSYWIENCGGITLDILLRADIIAADSGGVPWIWHDSLFTCSDIDAEGGENIAGLGIVAMIADGIIDDFSPSNMNPDCIPNTWWDEIDIDSYYPIPTWRRYPFVDASGTNLLSSDPALLEDIDGEYRRDNDQIELYFYFLTPPNPTSSSSQIIVFWVSSKISD